MTVNTPIVVATDFSATADKALAWAASIARETRSPLLVVHALEPPVSVDVAPEFVILPPDAQLQIQRHAERALEDIRARMRDEVGDLVRTELEAGLAVQVIPRMIAAHRARLLVVGTRGRTGFAKLLMGSTALRLVRKAPCPTLTVHGTEDGPVRPIRRVLIPTDFSIHAERATEAVVDLLEASVGPDIEQATLMLVHAYYLPADFPLDAAGRGFGPDAAQTAIERLESLAAPLRQRGLRVEVYPEEGYPPEVISDRARELQADLIAMGTHGRSGAKRLVLGSIAERVIPHAPCPVLTVRRPEVTEA